MLKKTLLGVAAASLLSVPNVTQAALAITVKIDGQKQVYDAAPWGLTTTTR